MPLAAMRFLAVLLLVLASVHAPVTSASAREDTRVDRRARLEADVVRELNRVRTGGGLKPLRTSPSLRTAARVHTRSMLNAGFFGHESPDGTSFSDRIRRYYSSRGWQTWSVGETLVATEGQSSTDAAEVVSAWLDSSPHREIILSPSFRDIGVGAFYAAVAPGAFDDTEAVVVTADFGLRAGRS
jgi:uncharacterized protein YkwD